jgi:hypothetical protein
MVHARSLVPVPVLAIFLLVGPGSRAEERPRLVPSRDVDVRYDVTRPQQPRVRERVRWLAGEGLERVDSSGRSTSIFERDAHAVTLLTPATRTFRKLDHVPRRPVEPEPGAAPMRRWRACPAPTGLGSRTAKSMSFAPPPTASSCGWSSTDKLSSRRARSNTARRKRISFAYPQTTRRRSRPREPANPDAIGVAIGGRRFSPLATTSRCAEDEQTNPVTVPVTTAIELQRCGRKASALRFHGGRRLSVACTPR